MEPSGGLGHSLLPCPLVLQSKTDWDEIFDEETCIGKSFEIFFCGGGNLTLGSTKR
jgi:hypothetical protein